MKNELQILLENFVPRGEQEISDLKIFRESAKDSRNLTRDSIAHFTASAFVLNEKHDKILGIFHKIYQSWGWMGGHADGDVDLLRVAQKEVHEESGLAELKILSEQPISIENGPVAGHFHRTHGYVSAHIHLNVTFLFEADEKALLHKNEEETAGVAWIPIDEFVEKSSEPEMKIIYEKIISRIKEKY
ncbi:NUDIX hydrolase [Lactococcus allomyrinae]|uniref:NUDIX domain-containing protein n=1 Tax=Lactococcus allomyrinae TaxID=2419773 RepID=A0A387BIP4_9LACT|nr:NUDIX hydrolase [Lactococcus allomyrinae]AYG00976.1 NUDIX domain-containing protein [Lactococcus allomyrinae]